MSNVIRFDRERMAESVKRHGGLFSAEVLFSDEINPEIAKLYYLKEVCAHSGILGEEPNWSEEYADKLNRGLEEIISGVVEKLESFEEAMGEIREIEHGLKKASEPPEKEEGTKERKAAEQDVELTQSFVKILHDKENSRYWPILEQTLKAYQEGAPEVAS